MTVTPVELAETKERVYQTRRTRNEPLGFDKLNPWLHYASICSVSLTDVSSLLMAGVVIGNSPAT